MMKSSTASSGEQYASRGPPAELRPLSPLACRLTLRKLSA